jgi:hypothetical protein
VELTLQTFKCLREVFLITFLPFHLKGFLIKKYFGAKPKNYFGAKPKNYFELITLSVIGERHQFSLEQGEHFCLTAGHLRTLGKITRACFSTPTSAINTA